MTTKFARQRSLFGGFEAAQRDPRGRKRIAWAKETAEKIVLLVSQKQTQEDIAAEVGLSVKTLVRIYADELQQGADLLRQAVFEAQVRRATVQGITSAARFVLSELDRQANGGHELRTPRRAPTAAAPAKEAPLGKKDQRKADAAAIGGLYAPGAPPSATSH